MTAAAPDVVVVGAGTVGACTAYELARAGLKVEVIDEGTHAAAGCSRANAGLLAPSHAQPLTGAANIRTGLRHMLRADSSFHIRPTPRLLPWLLRFGAASSRTKVMSATRSLRDLGAVSLQRHAQYREQGIATSFERRGLVDVFASAEARATGVASLDRTPLDLSYDVLDEAEVRALVPGITTTAGGVLFRDEAHCDSRVLVESLLAAAEELGARVSLGTTVHGLLHRRGRVHGVVTGEGPVSAGHVVVAGGHSSSALVHPLGHRPPLAPAKGYVIDLEAGPEDPVQPVGLKEDMVVLTPHADRIRLAGTLELVGTDPTIDARRVAAIRSAADRALPALSRRRTISTWAGLRPCSADGLPIIGTPSSTPGLVLATGHGQQGVLLAPGTGRIITDLLTDARSVVPREFSPDRFIGRPHVPWGRSGQSG